MFNVCLWIKLKCLHFQKTFLVSLALFMAYNGNILFLYQHKRWEQFYCLFTTMQTKWLQSSDEAHHASVWSTSDIALKTDDRLSKKKRQATVPEATPPPPPLLWLKADSDICYHKTSDRATTKPMTGDTSYPCGWTSVITGKILQ